MMTTTEPATRQKQRSTSFAFALLAWLTIQLIALSIAAARAPIWARFPKPGDRFAIAEMLATQVVAISLLFPVLLRDRLTSVAIASSALPFIALAGTLSSAPASNLMSVATMICVLIAGAALIRPSLSTRASESAGLIIAVTLSLGVPILHYILSEFGDGTRDSVGASLFSPTLCILGALREPVGGRFWICPLAMLALGIAARVRKRRCDRLSTADDHQRAR